MKKDMRIYKFKNVHSIKKNKAEDFLVRETKDGCTTVTDRRVVLRKEDGTAYLYDPITKKCWQ